MYEWILGNVIHSDKVKWSKNSDKKINKPTLVIIWWNVLLSTACFNTRDFILQLSMY